MKLQPGITLYALSTCVWCKKTKRLLDELGVDYKEIFVDLLSGREESDAIAEIVKRAGSETYPVMVLGNGQVICGYDEDIIRGALS
jgi:glutaredoxin